MATLDELLPVSPEPETVLRQQPGAAIFGPDVAGGMAQQALAGMQERQAETYNPLDPLSSGAGPSVALAENNGMVAMLDRDGNIGSIPKARVGDALAAGFQLASPDANRLAYLKEKYGDRPLQNFAEGAASTVTFGLTDMFQATTAEGREALAAKKEFNSGSRFAGELAGYLTPVGAAGAISKAGVAAGERVAGTALIESLMGGGTLARATGAAAKLGARAGAEGALMGVTQTAQEVALSADPMNAEAIAAALGSNMLHSGLTAGGVGAGLGGLGSVARAAAVRARSQVSRVVDGLAKEAAVPGDIAALDATGTRAAIKAERTSLRAAKDAEYAGLRAERDAEIEALKTAQQAERAAVAQDVLPFREVLRDAGKGLPGVMKKHGLTDGGKVREFIATERRMANVLDAVRTSPTRGIEALTGVERTARTARQAFDDMIEAQRAAIKPNEHGSIMIDPETRGFATPLRGETLEQTLARVRANVQLPQDVVPYMAKLDAVAEQASQLRARLEAAAAAPTSAKLADLETRVAGFDKTAIESERLSTLETHFENLKNPPLGQQLKDKALSILGGAAAAALGGGVFGTMAGAALGMGFNALKKAMTKSSTDFSARLSELADKAANGVNVAAPKLARNVALGTSLGGTGEHHSDDRIEQLSHDVVDAVANLDATRNTVHESLLGVRAVDPVLADQLEEQALRRLQYAASIAPKQSGAGGIGESGRGKASPSEMRRFGTVLAVLEQPMRVLEHLASDTLTPPVVDAVKNVYPEMFARIKADLLDKLVEPGRKLLSPARKLGLTMLTGNPVDTRYRPEYIARQQQAWAQMRADAQQKQQGNPSASQSRDALALTDLAPTSSQAPSL